MIPIGILMDPTRDLSDVARQQSLHGRRHHGSAGFLNQVQSSGDPGSLQCMADQDPGLYVPIITRKGLPDLCPEEAARVQRDNKAAAFVLERTRKFWQLLKSLRPSSVINPDVSFSFFHLNAYGLWARRMQLWSNQSKAPEGFVSSGWTNPVRPGRPL